MSRYQRQMQVAPIGVMGQEKLSQAHVGMVGVGGLGCPASLYLAGAGVGKLTLIDHDSVSLTNLHRQILYRENDIGRYKAKTAATRLRGLNNEIDIACVTDLLNTENINHLLADVDVIVDAGDNFVLSYLLSDFAIKHQKPLVSASVMQTSGYVGVYCFSTYAQKACPSLRAVFPQPPHVGQDCNSVGVIGTAAAMMGVLQAQEVLKVILGDKQQLAGRLLTVDCWSYRQSIIDFNQAPEPDNVVQIIAKSDIDKNDWIIDVRSPEEVKKQAKICHQHTPLAVLNVGELPTNKRLVFSCVSGQRALSAADKALQAGFDNVAVWL